MNEETPLVRSATTLDRPARDIERQVTPLNDFQMPLFASRRQSGHFLTDDDYSSMRTEILRELRSERLIGKSKPLADWKECYKSSEELKKMSPGLRDYYITQNELLEKLEQVDLMLDSGVHQSLLEEYGDDIGVEEPSARRTAPVTIATRGSSFSGFEMGTSSRIVKFWINLNLFVNFVLMGGKILVALLTNSLSVIASLIDSVLDLLSTIIIWFSANLADQRDWKTKQLYPVGRNRLEPIGVLVFSVVMVVSFLKVGHEAVQRLLFSEQESVVNITLPSLIIMIFTVVSKLAIYIACRNVESSSVEALAADAWTDIIFNVFSIIFPVSGHYLNIWWLDPLGALVLSCYVIYSWAGIAMEHINNLTGSAASPSERQQLLYLCMRFSTKIKYITALNAYHAGDRLMCEVDVLLDPSLNMRDCHDLAETLQYALETLPIVERAFVHLDYRRENYTGHIER